MARSITSFGMETALAALTARRRRGFLWGSGSPILAATVISFASLENIFERSLSCLPLRCWMFAHFEWPAMTLTPIPDWVRGPSPPSPPLPAPPRASGCAPPVGSCGRSRLHKADPRQHHPPRRPDPRGGPVPQRHHPPAHARG